MIEHGRDLNLAMSTSSSKKPRDDSERRVGPTNDRAQASLVSEELPQLVWKYFEEEIREALAEVDALIRSRQ